MHVCMYVCMYVMFDLNYAKIIRMCMYVCMYVRTVYFRIYVEGEFSKSRMYVCMYVCTSSKQF